MGSSFLPPIQTLGRFATGVSVMFTGIDVIVVFLVLMVFLYTSLPETEGKFKVDPFTMLVVILVVSVMIVSMA
jgi:hypothetical protein